MIDLNKAIFIVAFVSILLLAVANDNANTIKTSSILPSTSMVKLLPLKGGSSTFTSLRNTDVDGTHSNVHCMSVYEYLSSQNVDENIGLSPKDATIRLSTYGPNELPAETSQPLWKSFIKQFDDKVVQILLGVAILSSVLAATEHNIYAFAEPMIIITILTLNAIIGVLQSKSAENTLDSLKKLQAEHACVLRDGVWQGEMLVKDLVPGDILYLRIGDKVPADCRVVRLKTTSLAIDECSLTGESSTVSKNASPISDEQATIPMKTNMLFSGTLVTSGGCICIVTSTGAKTEIGKLNAGVQRAKSEQIKTPLGQKLDEFGDKLTTIIGGICLAVFIVSIPRFDSPVFKSRLEGSIHYAKIAVALGVAAIPEGLPMVITLCLSLGTRRMAQKNVIVRKLPSVETLGCTSVICTDKTGTLTTNQMTVTSLITFHEELDMGQLIIHESIVEGISYEPVGLLSNFCYSGISETSTLGDIAAVCSLCNEASVEYKNGRYSHIGEPTEAALKALVEKMGVTDLAKSNDPVLLTRQCNDYWLSKYKKLAILEFNRNRKSMSVLVRFPMRNDESSSDADSSSASFQSSQSGAESSSYMNRLLVKGAAEVLVERCNFVKLDNGLVVPISAPIRRAINAKISSMARRPLRCLAFAYVDAIGSLSEIDSEEMAFSSELLKDANTYIDVERNMTLVGLAGIKDPARAEAASAILKCRDAGIRVIMMTGDSKETAVAIAKDVNIFSEDTDVSASAFTGKEFFSLSYEEQINLLHAGNKVFCRTEPIDKQMLISMLTKLGEVVAMTGDGINDAPALQQADIGIAMGIAGTEVAKGVADMILTDDNFASIVSAVEEGRNIYSNMQAFICFLISCNIGEIVSIFLSTLLGIPEPLTPMHLLWVNLVTDGPPATALGFNPSDPHAMGKKPRPRSESIMSKWMLIRYFITGTYVGFATIGAFVWWYLDNGVTMKQLMNWNNCITWSNDFPLSLIPSEFSMQLADPCDVFVKFKSIPQSMSLSVLVTIEMLKALSAVSLDSSLLRIPPWKNPWLLLGVAVPFCLHLLVLYTPVIANIFGLYPISTDEWKVVLKFALPVLLLEEILKYIGRLLGQQKEQRFAVEREANKALALTADKFI